MKRHLLALALAASLASPVQAQLRSSLVSPLDAPVPAPAFSAPPVADCQPLSTDGTPSPYVPSGPLLVPREDPLPADPNQHYLWNAHFRQAHYMGHTGTGVVIGVIDSGVSVQAPGLAGKPIRFIDDGEGQPAEYNSGHGTAITQILIGSESENFRGGVAPDAGVVLGRFLSKNVVSQMRQAGARVVNWSAATRDTIADVTTSADLRAWMEAYRDYNLEGYQTLIAQGGGLLVLSTGNFARPDPGYSSAIPYLNPEFTPGWITVTALDPASVDANGHSQIAHYANRCGTIAMHYCMAAPGSVQLPNMAFSGTSAAAPMVSSAAALVWQLFPWMTNDQVRQTLFTTATDLGEVGVDAVYGQGALNTARALKGPAEFRSVFTALLGAGQLSVFSNPISGPAGLIKQGEGTLILKGENSYKGLTRVEGGLLRVTSGLAGGAEVRGGMLSIGGRIGGNAINAGKISVEGAGLHILQDYTQLSSASLLIPVDRQMRIDGMASLDGRLVVLAPDNYVVNNTAHQLILAPNITGSFNWVGTSSLLLGAHAKYDAGGMSVVLVHLPAAASIGALAETDALTDDGAARLDEVFADLDQKPSQASEEFVANAGRLQQLATVEQATRSLDSLSGQAHALAPQLTMDVADLADKLRSSYGHEQRSVFIAATAASGQLAPSEAMAARFHASLHVLGGNWSAGAFSWGAAAWQGKADAGFSRSGGNAHLRQRGVTLTASAPVQNAVVSARLSGASVSLETERTLDLNGVSSEANARRRGQLLSASVEVASPRAVTPFAGVAADRLSLRSFAEEGSTGFELRGARHESTRVTAQLGVRAQREIQVGKYPLRLQGHALYQHALNAADEAVGAQYAGAPTAFAIHTPRSASQAVWAGVQAGVELSPRSSLTLSAQGRFQEQGSMGAATLTWRKEW